MVWWRASNGSHASLGYLVARLLPLLLAAAAGCTPGPAPSMLELLNAKGADGNSTEELPRNICGSTLSATSRFLAQDRWNCDNGYGATVSPGTPGGSGLGQAQFWVACQAHDVCYWTPGQSREACDDALLADLKAECRAAFPPTNAIGVILPWMLNVFAGGQVREVGSCRSQCSIVANSYKLALDVSGTTTESFTAAQGEAAAVAKALEKRLGAEKAAAIGPRLGPLIGQACFRSIEDGQCDPERATDWVMSRVTEVEARCAALGAQVEDCAVYHCGGYEQVMPAKQADDAVEAQATSCVASCSDGVLRRNCS